MDINDVGSALKFGKCITVREYQLEDEYALIMKHITTSKFKIRERGGAIVSSD